MRFILIVLLMIAQVWAHTGSNSPFKFAPKMQASVFVNNYLMGLWKIKSMDIDIAGVDIDSKIIEVIISDEEFSNLQQAGFEIQINEVKGVTARPDREYKNPKEVETILKDFSARFPDLTKLVSFGKSVEGRDIWAIKISDNAKIEEPSESAVLFNSMHHAREIMTPEVAIDIIEYLLTNYSSDEQVAHWVNQNEIWVVPMLNVDGSNMVWTRDSYWRKNIRGGYGVDLNRNYPTGWNTCNGSSGSRRSQTYRGPEPASEPETKALMRLIKEIRPVFDISFHAFSEMVIYPFGCRGQRTPTKDVVEKIGKELGKLVDYRPGTAWELLYSADGGDIDWMYQEYQVIPYVFEVNSRREGFHPNYKRWRHITVKRNRPAWQYLLNRLDASGVKGVFTEYQGQKIESFNIQVFQLENGKKNLFQTYRANPDGSFHVVLNPGEYELIFDIDNGKKLSRLVQIGEDIIKVNL